LEFSSKVVACLGPGHAGRRVPAPPPPRIFAGRLFPARMILSAAREGRDQRRPNFFFAALRALLGVRRLTPQFLKDGTESSPRKPGICRRCFSARPAQRPFRLLPQFLNTNGAHVRTISPNLCRGCSAHLFREIVRSSAIRAPSANRKCRGLCGIMWVKAIGKVPALPYRVSSMISPRTSTARGRAGLDRRSRDIARRRGAPLAAACDLGVWAFWGVVSLGLMPVTEASRQAVFSRAPNPLTRSKWVPLLSCRPINRVLCPVLRGIAHPAAPRADVSPNGPAYAVPVRRCC